MALSLYCCHYTYILAQVHGTHYTVRKAFHLLELTIRLDTYPALSFTVIVNPDSGPGTNTLSDPNYARELPKLNSRKNVQTIGYVRTTWATRNISDVLQDVSTYSSWAENKTADYQVHGIFYDERGSKPVLNVADRSNKRIQRFTLEGPAPSPLRAKRSIAAPGASRRRNSGDASSSQWPTSSANTPRCLRNSRSLSVLSTH